MDPAEYGATIHPEANINPYVVVEKLWFELSPEILHLPKIEEPKPIR